LRIGSRYLAKRWVGPLTIGRIGKPALCTFTKENERRNKRDEEEKTKPDGTLVIPFIARLGEKISRIAKKVNIRTVFTSKSTLRNKLVHFNPKSDNPTKGVIYKIPCECGKAYIGETGRTLDMRLQEHKRSVQKRD
jgi:hypothetical protein